MAKTYRTGLVITGDASDGVKAINLTRDQLDKLNKTGQKTRAQMRETSAESERFTASLGNVAHKAAAWGAAFVGVNAIMGQLNQQLTYTDRIHKLNLRIGASTEALSEYAYVAELSGTNIEQLAVAWQRQTRRIAEAAQGTGVAKAALEELNLSATTLRTLAPEDQFMAIAGALENVAEKGDRLRLANAIFDSEGAAAALQIINQGTDAMDRMLERAQKLGVTIFQDQADKIATYNDAVTDMGYAWEGVNRVLAVNAAEFATDGLIELAEVIPTVTNALEYLDEAMIAGVAVTAGRAGGALAEKTKKLVASSQAARVAAESELYLAKQAQMRAVQDQAAAQRSLANAASMEARSAAGTRLARANQQVIATTKLMDAATANYQRTATLAGRAAAGLRSTMAFFGGPLGVVTMAVTAFALLSPRIFDNKTRIEELSEKAKEGANQLRNMAAATNQLSIAQAQANMVATAELLDDQSAAAQEAGAEVERLKAAIASMKVGGAPMQEFASQVRALEKELEEAVKTHSDLQANVTNSEQAYKQAKGAIDEIFSSQEKFNAALIAGGASSDDLTSSNEALIDSYIKFKAQLDEATNINKRYDDLIKEITKSDIDATKKKELLAAAEKKRAKDLEQLNKKQQDSNKLTKEAVDKNQELIQSLGDEIELMQLSGRERAIQTQLRRLDADATDTQAAAVRHLAGYQYDQQQAAMAAKDELKLAAEQTNVWADITENAVNSVDNSFRELFRSGLDGWDDFWDQMLDTAKDMLAELAYTLVKQQLWVNVGMNVTGQGGAVGAIAGQGGSLVQNAGSLLQNGMSLVRNGLDFFNPSSGYTTMAVNQTAANLGYGYAADGMGPPVALVNPNGYVAQGLNAVGPGLAAYGFGQQYGVLGGFAGGVGTAALAGGIGGAMAGTGFMAGASGALAGLGPVGWAAIAVGALLGGLGNKEPSNKEGRTTFDLGTGEYTVGGQSGDKFDQANRDASTQLANVIANAIIPTLNQYGTNQIGGSFVVGVGDRDPLRFHYDTVADGDKDWEYGIGRNNSQGHSYDTSIGSKTRNPEEFLGSITEFLAGQAGINVDFFKGLADEGELFYETLHRIETQFAVLSGVDLFADLEGVVGEAGKEMADSLAESIYAELGTAEEEQLETLLRVSNAWAIVTNTAEQLNQSLDVTGIAALTAATNIVELAGGVEALVGGANYYYQNYFTEQERAQDLVDAYTAMLSNFNAEFDAALTGRDDLRAFVESLDLTTEAGQEAYVAAMQLAPALVELESALVVVNEPARQLAQRGRELQASINDVVWGWMSSADQLAAHQAQIDQFNGALGLSGTTAINTRDELTKYLESLDLTTESGQAAAESALSLVNAINAVAEAEAAAEQARREAARASAQAARDAAKAERELAEQRLRNARSQLMSAFQSELSSLTQQQNALEASAADAKSSLINVLRNEISAQQAVRDEAEATAQAWRSAVEQLTAARSELLSETLNPIEQQISAQVAFNDALSQAWAGSMEAFQALPELAQSAQAAARDTSATGAEYRLATAQLVAQLDSAGDLAGSNASAQDRLVAAADQQLAVLSDELDVLQGVNSNLVALDVARSEYEAASLALANSTFEAEIEVMQQQLNWLQRLNDSVLSLPEAMAAYLDAGGEALPKFADGGIATGPTSGYRVELHGTEAVIPLKSGAVPVSINASGMGDELRALRAAIAQLNDDLRKIGGQQIKSAQRVESLIRKWDIDGQPEVRSA